LVFFVGLIFHQPMIYYYYYYYYYCLNCSVQNIRNILRLH